MKKWLSFSVFCLIIPAVVLLGLFVFEDKQYVWISLCVTVLSCVPFFLAFEKQKHDTSKMVIIAVMVALSVLGRIVFSPIPAFKPITAMVVITAMCFGREAGFMTGALSAVISNFSFGQGPWTPFQMFSWGMIGFVAGLIAEPLKRNKLVMVIYAVVSGIMYSCLMDVWSVLWADGFFNLSRYFALLITSLPFTAIYAVSNVIFMLLFSKSIVKILDRIKIKYAL